PPLRGGEHLLAGQWASCVPNVPSRTEEATLLGTEGRDRLMTTDDLRTRAREAAAILYADPVKDSAAVYTRHALRYYQRGAYEAGYLAHAAQQPSLPHRDELAAVILDATVPFRGPGGQTVPYVQPVHYAVADAVLALFDGAGS